MEKEELVKALTCKIHCLTILFLLLALKKFFLPSRYLLT